MSVTVGMTGERRKKVGVREERDTTSIMRVSSMV